MPEENVPQSQPPPPDPTLLGKVAPDELFARGMQTVKMTGGPGSWEPPSLEEATRLFPGYDVLKLLGRGGMGAVYQARELELDRLVAIKLLPLEISIDKDFADRFRREARAMAKLHHTNIVTVFAFGTTPEGHLFFVMEYVEGANLADIIRGAGLNPEQALSVMEQVCTALAYAHGKGIVHRDIKPANVMIDMESHVKVADFGLARLTDPTAEQMGHTMTGTIMGTPDYMAPEQMHGMNVDHRADIYSLGVMLYEMLCRQVPKGIFDPPSHRIACDARLDAIVIRAMHQSPDRRYQSTQEMKVDVIAARTPLTMEVSGPTQVVQPRVVPRQELAVVAGTAIETMQTIVPAAKPKARSKAALYGGMMVAALTLLGGVVVLVKRKPAPSMANDSGRTAESAKTSLLEPGAIRLWDTPDKLTIGAPAQTWEDNAMQLSDRTARYEDTVASAMLFRATVRLNADASVPQLLARYSRNAVSRHEIFYQLTVNPMQDPDQAHITLETIKEARRKRIGDWMVPHAVGADQWVPLEIRAVGSQLTVSFDGKALGTIADDTIPGPGGVGLFAESKGYFRDIVYVPLDKPASTAAPAAEPWQDVLRDPAMLVLSNGVERTPEGLRVAPLASAKLRPNQAPRRDGAVRLRATASDSLWLELRARHNDAGIYQIVVKNGKQIDLQRWDAVAKVSTVLREFPLHEPLKPGQDYELELRVVGQTLTAKCNGEVLGTVTDGTFPEGQFGMGVPDRNPTPVLVKSLEVLDLDAPGGGNAPPGGVRSGVSPTSAGDQGRVGARPSEAAKDAPFGNTLGMKFVPVPITGGPTDGQRVLFSIWETRVRDYEAFVKETKRPWPKVNFEQDATHPAVNVGCDDAQAFCIWLTEREQRAGKLAAGESYRLPTDHEWSCAVGIGDKEDPAKSPDEKGGKIPGVFPWGTQWPPPGDAGNFPGEEMDGRDIGAPVAGHRDAFPYTSPVGSFAATREGLFDLAGNAWEWCEDAWKAGEVWRIMRGGGYSTVNVRSDLFSSFRWKPSRAVQSAGGFRVVLVAVPPAAALLPASDGGAEKWTDGLALWRSRSEGLEWVNREGDYFRSLRQGFANFWTKPTMGDQAIRTTVRLFGGGELYLHARRSENEGGNIASYYAAGFNAARKEVSLSVANQGPPKTLQTWALPAGDVSIARQLELRAVGDRITVLVDQKIVGTVIDATLAAGSTAIYGKSTGLLFERLEYTALSATADATKDAPFVNSLGMKFVPVAITGGPADGQRVLFSIWETRVQDYEKFANETQIKWSKPAFEQGPLHPAVNVTWDDATAFCAWLTERERKAGTLRPGESYRLPDDHEWSCAVGIADREDSAMPPMEKSGKVKGVFPWNGPSPPPPNAGNYSGSEVGTRTTSATQRIIPEYRDDFVETAPVGSFPANPFGVFDLGGNVEEWCGDLLPGNSRVWRGGSFIQSNSFMLLSSNRAAVVAYTAQPYIGFRVVRSVVPPAAAPAQSGRPANTPAGAREERSGSTPDSATKEGPFVNSLGMKFVPVPIVGGPTDGQRVLFSIWETRAQDYQVFAAETKRFVKGPTDLKDPSLPVEMVSWYDAQAFCAWLTDRERQAGRISARERYRLPTDHEWSCAVGIGTLEDPSVAPQDKHIKAKGYPWGAAWPPPPGAGNFQGEEVPPASRLQGNCIVGYRDDFVRTAPVGSFAADTFGLFDLAGNAAEWCEDLAKTGSELRVVRGSAFTSNGPFLLQSSWRYMTKPSDVGALSFRVVLGRSQDAGSAK